MLKLLRAVYYFLPVQLLLLHFRKYQLLLLFWLILLASVSGKFASHYGATGLFLSPEYMGKVGFSSMFLTGCGMAVFFMSWQICTFIIHSKRIPYMGVIRHSFLLYCLNNLLLPLFFLITYSVMSIKYHIKNEHAGTHEILMQQAGLYCGLLLMIVLSFEYFFRVGRNKIKSILATITNPGRIRYFIPYDTLDVEEDIIHASSYLSGRMRIRRLENILPYDKRLLETVMRQHHGNAIFVTLIAYLILLLSGHFMQQPIMRFPAAVSFLLLFAIGMGLVGAVKYFLRSWETIGWVLFIIAIFALVQLKWLDLRSEATGINYNGNTSKAPQYNYNYLQNLYDSSLYKQDMRTDTLRLNAWLKTLTAKGQNACPVLIYVSGGGSRSAYWSFRSLQYLDSLSHGELFENCILITGASGGMMGAAYWRNLHAAYKQMRIKNVYDTKYQDDIGKDLLNAILFSLTTRDLISPFNKLNFGSKTTYKDRGNALDAELIQNTEGLLDGSFNDFKEGESLGKIPELIVNGTIINDGRRLMMSSQPLAFLCRSPLSLQDKKPVIDALDLMNYFKEQNPGDMKIVSAVRMNATFPYILPVVKMPSIPEINIMDAGMRDNFGLEVISRYLSAQKEWFKKHANKIIVLQIRDTKDYEIHEPAVQNNFGDMVADPAFVIQDKWEMFQSYNQGYLKEQMNCLINDQLNFLKFQYYPIEQDQTAELNFHLSQKEKEDIYHSTSHEANVEATKVLLNLLH
jgi:hypothetical protein